MVNYVTKYKGQNLILNDDDLIFAYVGNIHYNGKKNTYVPIWS